MAETRRIDINVLDDAISIDGRHGTRKFDALRGMGISALHWDGTKGEIEFIGHVKPNLVFDEFPPYEEFTRDVKWRDPPVEPLEGSIQPQEVPRTPETPKTLEAGLNDILLDYENRLRTLEDKAPLTMVEFIDWVWGKMKP
jgi:hypothetical protein